jgi:ribosomal protein S27AE
METGERADEWARVTDELWSGMQAWRAQHPRATLYEIEAEVEARLGAARSRLLEAAAVAGSDVDPIGDEARPRCPDCGATMQWDGMRARRLTTSHNRDVTLTRRHARCPRCGTGLFPPG